VFLIISQTSYLARDYIFAVEYEPVNVRLSLSRHLVLAERAPLRFPLGFVHHFPVAVEEALGPDLLTAVGTLKPVRGPLGLLLDAVVVAKVNLQAGAALLKQLTKNCIQTFYDGK
jgi:hypothetical protein